MLTSNYILKQGNKYTFPESADASTIVNCVFDRPVKRIVAVNAVKLFDSDDESITDLAAGDRLEFPSKYGYPQRFYISTGEDQAASPEIIVEEFADFNNEGYFIAEEPIIFAIRAKGQTANMLGKVVSSLQSSVVFDNFLGGVTGTLKYVSDYTGFSGDPALQKGNFLAWAVDTSETGVTYKAWVEGSEINYDEAHAVTLDSDKDAVTRVHSVNEVLVVKATKEGRATKIRRISFAGLTLAEE